MRIGEVGLLTNNGSNDNVHQTIIAEETILTIYNDGSVKNNLNKNICLAFTVDDVDEEYNKLVKMGIEIIEKPTTRPWGARNMSFYDPDNNIIYLRSFKK